MDDAVVIKLSKPINAHGEEIDEIELTRPDAGMMIDHGVPYLIKDGGLVPLISVIAKYVSVLGKIPMSSIRKMSIADMNVCMEEVLGFFGESGVSPSDS